MTSTHGHTRLVDGKRHVTKEWSTWSHMRTRVKPNPRYAARGIDGRWMRSFEQFLADIIKTIGPHPGDGYTLERVNNDRGYFVDNVRWATMAEQSRNRGHYDRNVRHLRRRCSCGMVSNPGAIGRHAKMKGHDVDPTYV